MCRSRRASRALGAVAEHQRDAVAYVRVGCVGTCLAQRDGGAVKAGQRARDHADVEAAARAAVEHLRRSESSERPTPPGPSIVGVSATAELTPRVARTSARAARGNPAPGARTARDPPAGPRSAAALTAWSMVVLLKSKVQLSATDSTSGVLADEKRRVAARRLAAARKPPTGEIAESSRAEQVRCEARDDRPEEADRSDEEEGVQLRRGGRCLRVVRHGRDGEQRYGGRDRDPSADQPAEADSARLDCGVGERACRCDTGCATSCGEYGEERDGDAAHDGYRCGEPAGGDGEVGGRDLVPDETARECLPECAPGTTPAADATSEMITASQAIMRRTWPGVAAIARSSAISCSRCWMISAIVPATTKIAMNMPRPPNDAATAINCVRPIWTEGDSAFPRAAPVRTAASPAAARSGRGRVPEPARMPIASTRPGWPARRAASESVRKITGSPVAASSARVRCRRP